ncbi:MAG TPA: hypothetical protein DD407_00380 [Pseudohongiella sp.]|nr:hypothetical protein [Gammaproteobacteria bacterium]HBN13462.1 hypothetical protein [Pseudohongiella sp.]|tara:strand:- start:2339 stop:3337 length:999 start_codon:yes stop_codon:yes gene_type:complete
MSRKPESVRKQAEAANATIKALGNTAQGDDQPIDATAQPGDQAKPPAETPETASVSDQPNPDDKRLDKPLGSEGDPWEQRYKILQGKYNKEVPDLHDQVRKLKQEVGQLREAGTGADSQELTRLREENAKLKQEQESASKPAQGSPDLDALREQYPPDLVDGILAIVKGMVAPLEQRVDSVDQTVSRTSKSSNVDRLRSKLKESGIDFDQVNTDPVFVQDFLGELAPYSSQTKGQLLQEAFESGDINRAAQFFIDYSGNRGSASGARDPKSQIDEHVSVHTPGQGGTPSTAGNVWNEHTIAQFYDDKRRGKYTPEEAKALEADLFASMNRAG